MKKLLSIIVYTLITTLLSAQVSKTINVATAGTLTNLLTSTEKSTITDLTVTGNINGADIECINLYLSRLSSLNISDVTIEEIPNVWVNGVYAYPANGLPYNSFNSNNLLTSINLPNSLTSIGNYAFAYCYSLKSITIPNSVISIGDNAFCLCNKLSGSLIIPNSVISIGNNAFDQCTGLNGSLTIGESVTTIGNDAFSSCSNLTGSLTIPNSVTSIGNYAFGNCNGFTGSLTIGNSVKTIGDYAFYNLTGLTGNLTLPNSITTIGKYAFNNCYRLTGDLIIPNFVTNIGEGAFSNCNGFYNSNLTLGSSLATIGNAAFDGAGFRTNINISNSITNIGFRAFSQCYILNYFVDEGNVRYSSLDGVLYNKNQDTLILFPSTRGGNFSIPNTVFVIGNDAFAFCTNTSLVITIPTSVIKIGDSAFSYCQGIKGAITLPNSIRSIGNSAFYGSKELKGNVTLPSSISSIGNYAFEECSNITSFTIPADCKRYSSDNGIIYSAQQDTVVLCPEAKSGTISIPNTVKVIGNSAFVNCNKLTGTLILPNSTTTIGDRAFQNCSGIVGNLTIPSLVNSIGTSSFYNCTGLSGSITIPNSVTTIGTATFMGCSKVTSISCYISNPLSLSLGYSVFTGINKNSCILYVPSGSRSYYQSNYQWKDFTNIIEMTTTNINKSELHNINISTDKCSIIIDGLAKDENATIYNINGTQFKTIKSDGDKIVIPIEQNGIFLIKTKNYMWKVIL